MRESQNGMLRIRGYDLLLAILSFIYNIIGAVRIKQSQSQFDFINKFAYQIHNENIG